MASSLPSPVTMALEFFGSLTPEELGSVLEDKEDIRDDGDIELRIIRLFNEKPALFHRFLVRFYEYPYENVIQSDLCKDKTTLASCILAAYQAIKNEKTLLTQLVWYYAEALGTIDELWVWRRIYQLSFEVLNSLFRAVKEELLGGPSIEIWLVLLLQETLFSDTEEFTQYDELSQSHKPFVEKMFFNLVLELSKYCESDCFELRTFLDNVPENQQRAVMVSVLDLHKVQLLKIGHETISLLEQRITANPNRLRYVFDILISSSSDFAPLLYAYRSDQQWKQLQGIKLQDCLEESMKNSDKMNGEEKSRVVQKIVELTGDVFRVKLDEYIYQVSSEHQKFSSDILHGLVNRHGQLYVTLIVLHPSIYSPGDFIDDELDPNQLLLLPLLRAYEKNCPYCNHGAWIKRMLLDIGDKIGDMQNDQTEDIKEGKVANVKNNDSEDKDGSSSEEIPNDFSQWMGIALARTARLLHGPIDPENAEHWDTLRRQMVLLGVLATSNYLSEMAVVVKSLFNVVPLSWYTAMKTFKYSRKQLAYIFHYMWALESSPYSAIIVQPLLFDPWQVLTKFAKGKNEKMQGASTSDVHRDDVYYQALMKTLKGRISYSFMQMLLIEHENIVDINEILLRTYWRSGLHINPLLLDHVRYLEKNFVIDQLGRWTILNNLLSGPGLVLNDWLEGPLNEQILSITASSYCEYHQTVLILLEIFKRGGLDSGEDRPEAAA